MTTHTKGPWHVDTDDGEILICPPPENGDWCIAQVFVRDESLSPPDTIPPSSDAEMKANACLMGAAPDLFKALEDYLNDDSLINYRQAEAALAKARGHQ